MSISHTTPVQHIEHLRIRHQGRARVHSHSIRLHVRSQDGTTRTINQSVTKVTAGPTVGMTINVLA